MKSPGSQAHLSEREGDCHRHGPYTAKVMQLGNREIVSHCPVCQDEKNAKEAEQRRAELELAKRNRIDQLLCRSGIPPRFQGRTFENYRAEDDRQKRAAKIAKAYAEAFEDRLSQGGGLVFCGKPGTGKTHLASAIANVVIRTGRQAVFASVLRVIRSVKETYRKDSENTEREVIREWMTPHLLILDEVGVQFGSDAEKMILFEILNGRYERMLPTILISNLTEAELSAFIGERVLDRLREGGGVVVAFDWDSYRGNVHKDKDLPTANIAPIDWEREIERAEHEVMDSMFSKTRGVL